MGELWIVDDGTSLHLCDTEEEARRVAETSLREARENARLDGWPEWVDQIFYGRVIVEGKATEIKEHEHTPECLALPPEEEDEDTDECREGYGREWDSFSDYRLEKPGEVL